MSDKQQNPARVPPLRWLLRVLQGILVGSGAILPGISGGVLCVSFGIYRPLMALLAHPLREFKTVFPQLLPVGIGWAAGFFGFARLLHLFFSADSNLAVCLFIGLIAGTVPGLVRQAGRQGRSGRDWAALAAGFGVMTAFFLLIGRAASVGVKPNAFWFVFCGVLWGLSLVIPGMTSSSTLIFLGLFEPMTAGISAFDTAVIVPMLLGITATVLLMARLINGLFERHFSLAFHAVLGIVGASTAVIVPLSYRSAGEGLACLALAAAGFLVSYGIDRKLRSADSAET